METKEQPRPMVTPAVFGVWNPAHDDGVILDAFGSTETGFNLRVAEVDRQGQRVERLETFASQDELVQRWNSLMQDLLNAGYRDSLLVPPADAMIFVPRHRVQ